MRIDETRKFHKALEDLEREGRLGRADKVMIGFLMDISLSLARITDALENMSEVEECLTLKG